MNASNKMHLYLRVWRAVALYAVFAAVSAAACFFFIFFSYSFTDRPLGDTLDRDMFFYPFLVQGVVLFFFLGSLIRTFAERDAVMRDELYEGAENVGGFRQNAGAVLRSKFFWTEFAVLSLLPLLLPLECGFYPLTYALFSHATLSRAAQKALLLCIVLPLTFALLLWHHAGAFYTWQEAEIAKRPDNTRQIAGPVAGTAALYFICLLLIPPVLSALMLALSFLASVSLSLVGAALLAAVLLGLLLRYLRALRIRHKFMKNLRQRCEKCGFELSAVHRPYRSVLRPSDGVDFTVKAHGKTYSCKLLAGLSRGNAMALSPEGIAYTVHVIGLRIRPPRSVYRTTYFMQGDARKMLGGESWYTHMELFRFTTKTDFSFAGDGQRILIVNPVPYALYAGTEKHASPIDNGERVGAYKVFTGSAFLNALERNCVDK